MSIQLPFRAEIEDRARIEVAMAYLATKKRSEAVRFALKGLIEQQGLQREYDEKLAELKQRENDDA